MEEERREKTEEVYCVDYSKELNMLISGGGDDAVSFYTYEKGEYLLDEVIEGLEDSVIYTAFISREAAVAVSMDGSIILISLSEENGRVRKEVEVLEYQADISYVAKSRNNQFLYLGLEDGVERVSLSNPKEREENYLYKGHRSPISHIEESEKHLFTASQEEIIIYNIETKEIVATHKEQEINVIKLHPNGKLLSVGTEEGKLILFSFSATNNSLTEIFKIQKDLPIECMEYSDGLLLFGGFLKKFYSLDTQRKLERSMDLPNPDSCIVGIFFLSSSFSLITTNLGEILLVDIKAMKIIKTYEAANIILTGKQFTTHIALGTAEGLQIINLSK
ncbi:hypothetical protein NEFER03_0646 [Nematocida sp. LUAm3]|nr:hypothetical protein NEFER03_0646 [Nematocida sp. LUAm3]KAI5176399.1 hypothetical protein NEFER02_2170 [Nematocida sp. LUAm2]KAI5179312.1 hypothetical protein NEFER01_2160 [Nematocida sp. LUAm1]